MPDTSHLLPQLERIAREAGDIARGCRRTLTRDFKADRSIVTSADLAVENFLRLELSELLPGSTIWGEEFGFAEDGGAGWWLIDPIDGTTNFAYGSPFWGVSIALMKGSQIVLGTVALPELNELYICAKGGGVTLNGKALPPIPPGPIGAEEPVSYGRTISHAVDKPPGKLRNAGAFVIDGTFTAAQRIRGLIGIREKLYDVAPCILFVQELGGEVRYADGKPMDLAQLKIDRKIERPWLMFPANSGFLLSWPP